MAGDVILWMELATVQLVSSAPFVNIDAPEAGGDLDVHSNALASVLGTGRLNAILLTVDASVCLVTQVIDVIKVRFLFDDAFPAPLAQTLIVLFTVCPKGFFGEKCAQRCKNCKECHFETGRCLCTIGQYGESCERSKKAPWRLEFNYSRNFLLHSTAPPSGKQFASSPGLRPLAVKYFV